MTERLVNSPKKNFDSPNQTSDSRIKIKVTEPRTGRRWFDRVSIPFDIYVNKIKSLKKSDFE